MKYGGNKSYWRNFDISFWGCACLYRYNQQCYRKTKVATGFSSSKWSRNHLNRLSNFRLEGYYRGKKWCWGNFENLKIGSVFACTARTHGDRVKQRAQLDSARWIGLGTAIHGVFDRCGDVWTTGEKVPGQFRKLKILALLWLWTHNQLSYDRRECTTRFSLWNMPREHLSRTFWLWWWPVKEWWSKFVRNFLKRELGMFLLVALKPGVIETNRGHGWI